VQPQKRLNPAPIAPKKKRGTRPLPKKKRGGSVTQEKPASCPRPLNSCGKPQEKERKKSRAPAKDHSSCEAVNAKFITSSD